MPGGFSIPEKENGQDINNRLETRSRGFIRLEIIGHATQQVSWAVLSTTGIKTLKPKEIKLCKILEVNNIHTKDFFIHIC